MNTLLVTRDQLDADSVVVEGDAYRHLFRALRLKKGDSLRIVDGSGGARFGVIQMVDRRQASVLLGGAAPDLEPPLEVELLVAQLRAERAGWLVEKATELGVRRIVWMKTERSQQDWPAAKLERFERVARSAVEQCGRARLPELVGPLPFPEVLSTAGRGGRCLIAHVRDDHVGDGGQVESGQVETPFLEQPGDDASERRDSEAIRVLIGPEGGFTDEEIEQALAVGCIVVDLGDRILRVETAAVAILARLLAR